MKKNDITLFNYTTSPYGRKILAVLKYKNIKFSQVFVNPITTKEIKFSNQKMVPLLKVGNEWKVDSNQQALWIDSIYNDNPLFGLSVQDKENIQQLVTWCDEFFIASMFKVIANKKNPFLFWLNCYKLGKRVTRTSQNLPFFVPYIWFLAINKADFIHREANKVKSFSQTEVNEKLKKFLLQHLNENNFLYGNMITFVDLSFYAQIEFLRELKIKVFENAFLNSKIDAWFTRVKDSLASNAKND